MNVLGTQYTLNNRAFEIYLAGCSAEPHCPGCHNPEAWDFSKGEKQNDEYISSLCEKIVLFGNMIENIWILGGDPLDQDLSDLLDLIISVKYTQKKIWIFTRYEIDEVPDIVKQYVDYIKTGRYEENSRSYTVSSIANGIKLASKNQKIYKKTKEGWQLCE